MAEWVISSKTMAVLARAIDDGCTHTVMDALFLEAGIDSWEPQPPGSKLARTTKTLQALKADGSEQARQGTMELARLMLVKGKAQPGAWRTSGPLVWWPGLRDALASDGWEFSEAHDQLMSAVPSLQLAEELTWIEDNLSARGWTVPAGHYKQAVDSFGAHNWASANGQLRSCFEATVRLAAGLSPSGGGAGQVQRAFDSLAASNAIPLDEASFGKSLWKLLHPNGSHPGLSDEDESRFRLLTLTGYLRHLLTRV